MTTLASIKREFALGREFILTNHYITREDHPCFGTRRARVERVTSSRVYVRSEGREVDEGIDFPRASQATRDSYGTLRFYGGGIGQGPEDLFLTFSPAPPRADS